MKQLNIVGNRKIFFGISIVLIVITILASLIMGVKMDIQFKGGSLITYSYDGEKLSNEEVASLVKDTVGLDATVSDSFDMVNQKNNVEISITTTADTFTTEDQEALTAAMEEKYADRNVEMIRSNNVDPAIGGEFFAKSLTAVAFASILIIIYVAIRFRRIGGWSAGVMGVIALVHDAIMVYAVFVLCGMPLNANFIAVVLTILGYSINDTIVIYDRIRENKRLYGKKYKIGELVNLSINQSLERSISTTVTTVLAMLVVLIVALVMNVDSIISFALPLIIGMISGVYSSVCLSGPLWVVWQEHKEKKKSSAA